MIVVPIPIDLAAEALSANGREDRWKRAARTAALRDKSFVLHRKARGRTATLPAAHLTVRVTWPDLRRRDVSNLMPTVKALVDGAVDARMVPDDDDRHLVGPDLRVTPTVTGKRDLAVLVLEWAPIEAPIERTK